MKAVLRSLLHGYESKRVLMKTVTLIGVVGEILEALTAEMSENLVRYCCPMV